MVPVGGSLIYSPKRKALCDKISKLYPGRASASPIIDLFITFLQMGEGTLKSLLKQRRENYKYLKESLESLTAKYGEKCLNTPNNKISLAITLVNLNKKVF
jgi:O-phospho-L-seryl-tRNASec:L-selenocysteinyl-tRNA synthase